MRWPQFKLTGAAAAYYQPAAVVESNPFLAGLAAAHKDMAFEVFPENWPAFTLFCKLQTQWCYASSGMGAYATGLNYLVLFALMDRMKLLDADHDNLFEDVQTLERAALTTMNQKD